MVQYHLQVQQAAELALRPALFELDWIVQVFFAIVALVLHLIVANNGDLDMKIPPVFYFFYSKMHFLNYKIKKIGLIAMLWGTARSSR